MTSVQDKAAGGKRKRDGGANTSPDDDVERSPPTPQKSTRRGDDSGPAEDPPYLANIRDAIESLRNGTRTGVCPRCLSGERTKRNGKIKGRGGVRNVQRYYCKGCKHNFNESPERIRSPHPVAVDFEGKRKLQGLFRRAYGELAKRDMTADALEFERKMASLRGQLREKRRNISRLLGIPLEEDLTSSDRAADVEKNANSSEAATSRVDNPFREIILLLRDKTPKLERAVDRLMIRRRNSSSNMEVRGSTASFLGSMQQALAEEEELSSVVDVVTDHPPKLASNCNETYKLASRIIQEGEEEIEIYERCTGGDY